MARFRGVALTPPAFFAGSLLPVLCTQPRSWHMLGKLRRKYFGPHDPDADIAVGQISLRVNEVCNLRCASCGQWGENGHLAAKLRRGEKLQQLDFEVVKRVVETTAKDKPVYYIWGGEPTMWKPLTALFSLLARHGLYGSIVTNAQALSPVLEELIDTGALQILFLSLDGWDAESQNLMRSPASGATSDNFEKTMAVIDQAHAIKQARKLHFPIIAPITVISNQNYSHLAEIHRLVLDKTQLHPYYYGWFVTEERAAEHERVFQERFGHDPRNHRGYLKSCFNDVDARVTAQQVAQVRAMSRGKASAPQFLPDFYREADIARYYAEHRWHCGYPECKSIYYIAEISPDGRVTPCRDYQDYSAGNINEQDFYGIWHGEAFKEFRRQMKKGLMPVCTRCCGLQGF